MKKIFTMLLLAIVLIGCSDNSNEGVNEDPTNEESKEHENNVSEQEEENKTKVYQIGETAVITSDIYEFDYEVTVTDFNLTTEVDDTTISDFITGANDRTRFAVVDVTIKNISDEEIIPNRQFSANLGGDDEQGGEITYNEFFPEGDETLEPGQEVNGHLVYTTFSDYADNFVLKYELMSDEETHFILPNPEK